MYATILPLKNEQAKIKLKKSEWKQRVQLNFLHESRAFIPPKANDECCIVPLFPKNLRILGLSYIFLLPLF